MTGVQTCALPISSSHLGLLSRILPLAEVYGPAVILTNHREVPLSERRMVLYTYSAPDVSPADPCNKMARRRSGYLAAAVAMARVLDGGFGFALIRIARPSG